MPWPGVLGYRGEALMSSCPAHVPHFAARCVLRASRPLVRCIIVTRYVSGASTSLMSARVARRSHLRCALPCLINLPPALPRARALALYWGKRPRLGLLVALHDCRK